MYPETVKIIAPAHPEGFVRIAWDKFDPDIHELFDVINDLVPTIAVDERRIKIRFKKTRLPTVKVKRIGFQYGYAIINCMDFDINADELFTGKNNEKNIKLTEKSHRKRKPLKRYHPETDVVDKAIDAIELSTEMNCSYHDVWLYLKNGKDKTGLVKEIIKNDITLKSGKILKKDNINKIFKNRFEP